MLAVRRVYADVAVAVAGIEQAGDAVGGAGGELCNGVLQGRERCVVICGAKEEMVARGNGEDQGFALQRRHGTDQYVDKEQ